MFLIILVLEMLCKLEVASPDTKTNKQTNKHDLQTCVKLGLTLKL